jgi:hypothetical protein
MYPSWIVATFDADGSVAEHYVTGLPRQREGVLEFFVRRGDQQNTVAMFSIRNLISAIEQDDQR